MTTKHSFSADTASVEKAKVKMTLEHPRHAWITEIQQTIFQLYADHTLKRQHKMGWLIQLYMTVMNDNRNNGALDHASALQESSEIESISYDVYGDNPQEQEQQEMPCEYWLSQLLIEMLQIHIHERHPSDSIKETQKRECDTVNARRDDFTVHLQQFKFNLSFSNQRLLDTALQHAACLYTAKKKLHTQYLYPSLRQKRWQQLLDRERDQLQPSHRLVLVRLWLDYIEQHPKLLEECMQSNGQPESDSMLGSGRIH
ncbi:hypothetical protein [Paenibacillus kandeliae]|uniref:hypothetical protein n=1 Tax=Paenibacillus kandeliae TaxID=3231269 RepID=UPI003458FC46